jgi:hypothetical protein
MGPPGLGPPGPGPPPGGCAASVIAPKTTAAATIRIRIPYLSILSTVV